MKVSRGGLIWVAVLLVTGAMILLGQSGCVMSVNSSECPSGGRRQKDKTVFRCDGITAEHYRVGGGYEVGYEASVKGTAYYVEETTGKLMVTRALHAGERFDICMSPTAEEQIQKVLSIPLKDAVFVLYFIPAVDMPFEAATQPADNTL
ncbi:MAG: hypothetical protein GXY33_21320 [Phycisphaerae bacterium]|nr:hypothetical protein [Phycisphaerae bacterium]